MTLLPVSTIASHCSRLLSEVLSPQQLVYQVFRRSSMRSTLAKTACNSDVQNKVLFLTALFPSGCPL